LNLLSKLKQTWIVLRLPKELKVLSQVRKTQKIKVKPKKRQKKKV